MTYEIIAEL